MSFSRLPDYLKTTIFESFSFSELLENRWSMASRHWKECWRNSKRTKGQVSHVSLTYSKKRLNFFLEPKKFLLNLRGSKHLILLTLLVSPFFWNVFLSQKKLVTKRLESTKLVKIFVSGLSEKKNLSLSSPEIKKTNRINPSKHCVCSDKSHFRVYHFETHCGDFLFSLQSRTFLSERTFSFWV